MKPIEHAMIAHLKQLMKSKNIIEEKIFKYPLDKFFNIQPYWRSLKDYSPIFNTKVILSSFLENEDNYKMFLKDYEELYFSIHKYDSIFAGDFIEDKAKAVHFLSNCGPAEKFHSFYTKAPETLLKLICIGNPQENEAIVSNFLEQSKGSFGPLKLKIKLRTALEKRFGKTYTDNHKQYWETKAKTSDLMIKFPDTKVLTYFVDKKVLINDYSLKSATSNKSYSTLLDEVCAVVGEHFKFKGISSSIFNNNIYVINAIAQSGFNQELDSIWQPLIEKYTELTNKSLYSKQQLQSLIPKVLMNEKLEKSLPEKTTENKKLKI